MAKDINRALVIMMRNLVVHHSIMADVVQQTGIGGLGQAAQVLIKVA